MTMDCVNIIERKIPQYIGRILLFIFFCGGIFLYGCAEKSGENGETSHPLEVGQVKVTFFDVGKGDAILVETLGHSMLIDSGYDDTSGILLSYMEEQSISDLDYLVLTHLTKTMWAELTG